MRQHSSEALDLTSETDDEAQRGELETEDNATEEEDATDDESKTRATRFSRSSWITRSGEIRGGSSGEILTVVCSQLHARQSLLDKTPSTSHTAFGGMKLLHEVDPDKQWRDVTDVKVMNTRHASLNAS
jgi:hypothetical protein